MDWAKALKDYRRHHKLTQEALAGELGVDPKTVRRWERGATLPNSRMQTLLKRLTTTTLHNVSVNEVLIVLVDTCAKSALLLDNTYKVIRTSLHHQQMYNYKPEDLWGRSYREIAPPDVMAFIDASGGPEMILKDAALVRKQLRAARPPSAGLLEKGRIVYSRNDVYFIRENGIFLGLLAIATEITAAEYEAMPAGLH
jgi:transcriptional regulator with XRE-family HTH domain